MRTITYKLADLGKAVIHLGKANENEATRVQIDAGVLFAEYQTAVPTLKVINPAGTVYSAEVTRDGDYVLWDIKDSDLTENGSGDFQLTFTENGVVVKSAISRTQICPSITGGGTAPDPVQDWLDHAEEVLEEVEDAFPEGGTTGQVLAKKSNDDYDTEWVDQSSGTVDYTDLTNKPQIGGVTLSGNKSLSDLGAASAADVSAKYTKPAGGIPASDIADGVIPDPTSIIDDTAGDGDTNKVWSADKVNELKSAITNIEGWVGYTEETIPVLPTAVKSANYDNGTYRFKYANGKEQIGITKASGQTFTPICNYGYTSPSLLLDDVCYDLAQITGGDVYIQFSTNLSTSDFAAAGTKVDFYFAKDGPTHQKTVSWTIPSTGQTSQKLKIADLASANNVDLTVCHYFCVRGISGTSFTSTSEYVCDIYVDGLIVKGGATSIIDTVGDHETRIDALEDAVDALEETVESNTDRITALEARPISSGGTVGMAFALTSLIPSYYFAEPANPADFDDLQYLEGKIASVPDGKHFIFVTDTHWGINQKKSIQLIGYVKERLKIDRVIFGGDAITRYDTKYLGYQNLTEYVNASKAMFGDGFMWCMGNHDNNMANATGTEEQLAAYAIPYSQIAKLTVNPYVNCYAPTAKVNELISNTDDRAEMMAYFKNCYYFDSGTTRFIIYNTGTVSNNSNPAYKYFAVGNVAEPMLCLDWLYETLLSTPANYDVVVIGHEVTYEYGNTYFTNSNKHVPAMLIGLKNKASTSVWIPTTWDSKLFNWISSGTHTYDFSTANTVGKIMMLQGHWHKDFSVVASGADTTINGTGSLDASISVNQSTATEIPIITTTCDAMPQPAEAGRTADTITEQAFDIITIAENKVYFTRVGGYSDRVVTFT